MLIALNEPYSGRMGGLAKIDKMCSTQAKEAGYFGLKFHSLISDNYNDVANMIPFRSRKKPVANTRVSTKENIMRYFLQGGQAVSTRQYAY